MNQLTMFEPKGDELAALAARSVSLYDQASKQAENLALRGFNGAADAYARIAQSRFIDTHVLMMAVELEQLGFINE